MPIFQLRDFLKLESSAGILLVIAAAFAIVLANSPANAWYEGLLSLPVVVQIGQLAIDKPLLLWVNDGLMAIFFLLIGLEIKREIMDGQLSNRDQIVLPSMAAIGGFAIPALIYVWFNWGDESALNGWAIPAATDIAFALGVLAVLGSRVPLALKVFLTTVAIIDDLMAIIVIAVFYSQDLSVQALSLAAIATAALFIMNRLGVDRIAAYVGVGVLLWTFVLKSGVHATLAGVLVGAAIPLTSRNQSFSPLRTLEHSLHPWVAYGILPFFAFANAGISFAGLSLNDLLQPIPLGIALGLFVGKQIGVFGMVWITIKTGLARMPAGVNWLSMYGVATLTGIGFTMSLFIGSLAFEHGNFDYGAYVRLGVLGGSILSAIVGLLILKIALPAHRERAPDHEAGPQSAQQPVSETSS